MTVVEVGPGPGRAHPRAAASKGAARVVAIEKDQRCLPALADIAALYPGRLDIVAADAREVDYAALALPSPARIVANLPYSVATPLLIGWLKTEPWPPWFDRLVLMFQREFADRIVAAPGGKDYGRLAVLSQWRTTPRILFTLPAAAFTPRPKVDSALVELVPARGADARLAMCPRWRKSPPRPSARGERCCARRCGRSRPDSEALLERLGIDPKARAEELAVGDFCRIANALAVRAPLKLGL